MAKINYGKLVCSSKSLAPIALVHSSLAIISSVVFNVEFGVFTAGRAKMGSPTFGYYVLEFALALSAIFIYHGLRLDYLRVPATYYLVAPGGLLADRGRTLGLAVVK